MIKVSNPCIRSGPSLSFCACFGKQCGTTVCFLEQLYWFPLVNKALLVYIWYKHLGVKSVQASRRGGKQGRKQSVGRQDLPGERGSSLFWATLHPFFSSSFFLQNHTQANKQADALWLEVAPKGQILIAKRSKLAMLDRKERGDLSISIQMGCECLTA